MNISISNINILSNFQLFQFCYKIQSNVLPFCEKLLLRTFEIYCANLNENESYEEIIGPNFRFVE